MAIVKSELKLMKYREGKQHKEPTNRRPGSLRSSRPTDPFPPIGKKEKTHINKIRNEQRNITDSVLKRNT